MSAEHDLQLAVTRFLTVACQIHWTAVDHAAKLSKSQAGQRKARGVKRGQPDYRFILPPHGQSAEIELKVKGTYQSPEQKDWQAAVVAAGGLYAICRTAAEVEATLRAWGVPLKARLA